MKTALLISGLPRNVERGYPGILSSLMETNNPDVFIHTWYDPEKHGNINDTIIKLFNPKKFIFEKPKVIVNSHIDFEKMIQTYASGYKRDPFVEMLYSSWYSILQSSLLKEQYRLENDIAYDYVIRARYDISYSKPVICSQFDPNILHISNRPGLPPEMIDDRFAFSSEKIMNVYCGGFNLIDYLRSIRTDGVFCGETLVYEVCRLFGINHRIDDLHCGFIR